MARETQKVVETSAAPHWTRGIVVPIAVVLLLLVSASIALLWRLGVFDPDTRASNAQMVAAALGLVGVLVTASLTFVGVLLKHSIDARTLQQTAETEGRLRLETSIRAVELLTENGKPATPTRQAGALFVLTNLNQLDFAYALLGQLWSNREISPGAAVWVVNRLLLNGDASLQHEAAILLDANADTLATSAGYEFPECVNLSWTNELSTSAREYLVSALLRALLAKPRHEWQADSLNAAVLQFDIIRRTDDVSYLRRGAAYSVDALLDAYEDAPAAIYAPEGRLLLEDIRAAAKVLVEEGTEEDIVSTHLELAGRLRSEWA